jgi:hypothetical protein
VDAIVEAVEAPVAAAASSAGPIGARDLQATPVAVARGTVTARTTRGRTSVALRLGCPAAEAGGCNGSVTVIAKRPRVVLGSSPFLLRAGERRAVRVRLRAARVARLATGRRHPVQARTVSRDAAGNAARRIIAMTLRFPMAR